MYKVKMNLGTINLTTLEGSVHGGSVCVLECNGYKKNIVFTSEGVYGYSCGLITLIEAFNLLQGDCQVVIYTEGSYFKNAIECAETWKSNGWMLKGGTKVKNQSLIEKLYAATHKENIKLIQIVSLAKGALKPYSEMAVKAIEKDQGVQEEGCAF